MMGSSPDIITQLCIPIRHATIDHNTSSTLFSSGKISSAGTHSEVDIMSASLALLLTNSLTFLSAHVEILSIENNHCYLNTAPVPTINTNIVAIYHNCSCNELT